MPVLACISCTASRRAVGLTLSLGDYFERLDVEVGLGEQLLQPAVFQIEILQALGIRHGHAAELVPPGVERGITETVPAAQPLYRDTDFDLLRKSRICSSVKRFFTAVSCSENGLY